MRGLAGRNQYARDDDLQTKMRNSGLEFTASRYRNLYGTTRRQPNTTVVGCSHPGRSICLRGGHQPVCGSRSAADGENASKLSSASAVGRNRRRRSECIDPAASIVGASSAQFGPRILWISSNANPKNTDRSFPASFRAIGGSGKPPIALRAPLQNWGAASSRRRSSFLAGMERFS